MQRAPKSIRWSVKAWGLALSLISSLFFVMFQGGKLSMMLLIILSCLSIYLALGRWSGIASARGRRNISGMAGAAALQAGSALQVNIVVGIPGIWPIPYVTVKDVLIRRGGETHIYEGTFVPDWKRKGELSYTTPPLSRGLYRYEAVECTTQDIFGLFEHKGVVSMPMTFSVLPRTIAIPEWSQLKKLFKGNHQQTSAYGTRRESTQMNGVREYIYGDRLAKVHWNATARTGEWKSKEFERESLPKLVVILDRLADAYQSKNHFELSVSVAASLLRFAEMRRMNAGFASTGKDRTFVEPPGGWEARKRIEQHLIDVQMDAQGDCSRIFRDRLHLPVVGSVIVLVSPQRGESMTKQLKWLNAQGAAACHMWVTTESNAAVREAWRSTLRSMGITSYSIQKLEDLPLALGGSNL